MSKPNTTLPHQSQIPATLHEKLSAVDPLELEAFSREYSSSRKSKALVFWLLLPCGLHYAYVGRWWLSIAFIFIFAGMCVWWIIDTFRVCKIIRKYNEDLAFNLYRKYKFPASVSIVSFPHSQAATITSSSARAFVM